MDNNGIRSFYAGEALEKGRRVKLKSASTTTPLEVEYADAADNFIGVTLDKVASGALVAVKLKRGHTGTFEVEAAGAITKGDTIYGAADGKVSTASTNTDKFGFALETASGDGAKIEALCDD